MSTPGMFVGLTNLDFVYYIDEYPKNNTKVKTGNYKKYIGGPAANAAITYALLGGSATLLTCLGQSNEAKMVEAELAGYGVKVINCAFDVASPNISTITVDKYGNRTIFSGQTKYNDIKIPELDRAEFVLFDLNQQELALQILDKTDCEIVLDAGSYKENTDLFLKKADIIISSENFKNKAGQNIFECDTKAEAKCAITRGNRDILLKNGTIPVDSDIICVDSLAAGDIFHGAFCFAYYNEKKGFEDALIFANKIAEKSIQYYGPREWIKHI